MSFTPVPLNRTRPHLGQAKMFLIGAGSIVIPQFDKTITVSIGCNEDIMSFPG